MQLIYGNSVCVCVCSVSGRVSLDVQIDSSELVVANKLISIVPVTPVYFIIWQTNKIHNNT